MNSYVFGWQVSRRKKRMQCKWLLYHLEFPMFFKLKSAPKKDESSDILTQIYEDNKKFFCNVFLFVQNNRFGSVFEDEKKFTSTKNFIDTIANKHLITVSIHL